jgi:Tfp pilus assembly PilM family ATPase
MANRLAIDWEPHRLCGIQADVSSGGIRIQKAFSIEASEAVINDPSTLGHWLADELKSNRIDAKQLSVSLPRENVVVRHLELPYVSDAELPDLVNYQAAAKSTIPMGQLLLDYVPLPEKSSAGRQVLVATVNKELVDTIRTAAGNAGLELVSVGVSSIAAAELITRAEANFGHAPGDVSVIVAQHGDRVEITLWEGAVYFTHSTLSSSESAVLAEISRAVIAVQKQIPDASIHRAWIIGDARDSGELGNAIKGRFDCQVSYFDPFTARGVSMGCSVPDGSAAAFAGPIGQLLGQSTGRANSIVDFLRPRKAVVKTDFQKVKKYAIAAAVVVVLLGLFTYRWFEVNRLDAETAKANSEAVEREEQNTALEPRVEQTGKVSEWVAGSVNWLEESKQLTETMNGTDNYYLTRLRFANGSRSVLGTVNAKGHAKHRVEVEALKAQLMKRENLELQAKPTPETNRDGDFPYEFELDFNLNEKELASAAGKK